MAMARFLVGSELSYEAIGLLNALAREHPEMLDDPEFRADAEKFNTDTRDVLAAYETGLDSERS